MNFRRTLISLAAVALTSLAATLPLTVAVARPGLELTAVTIISGVEFEMLNWTIRVSFVMPSATVRSVAPEITGGAPGPTFTVKLLVLKLTPSVAARLTVVTPTSPLGTKLKR